MDIAESGMPAKVGIARENLRPSDLHRVIIESPYAGNVERNVAYARACLADSLRRGEPSAESDNVGAIGFHMRPGARRNDSGSAARFFYCAKASKADRDDGLDAFAPQQFVQFQTGNGESGEASSLSEGRSTVYRNIHPTVKPEALMRYLVRLVAPAGGTVLDPFMGSGSTGKAAVLEGLDFIGCEMTAKYIPIAEARIAAAARRLDPPNTLANKGQGNLFGEVAA